MRNHTASINNGTPSKENSSKEPPQSQQGSSTESSRIDAIRIIGSSGEDEESLCIGSAGVSKGASACIPEIKIQSTVPDSNESKHREKANDDAGRTEIVKDDEKNSIDRRERSINGKYDSEVIACAVPTEIRDRSLSHNTMNYFDQLAVKITKLAIKEVPRYHHRYKGEAEHVRGVEGQESKGRAKYNQLRLPSHSKIHDYINGISRSIMQMSKHEVAKIKRSKQGYFKSRVLTDETDFAVERKERNISSLGASNLDHVYKSGDGTRAKNSNIMIDAECASCGIITGSQCSWSVNITAERKNDKVAYGGTQWLDNKMIAADSQNQPFKGADYHAKQQVCAINGSYDSPILYDAEGSKASKVNDAICKVDVQSDSAQNSAKAAVERFAQSLAENVVKEAISRTISFPLQKHTSLNMTTKLATCESMQSKDSRMCTHTWLDDHVTKISTESKFEGSKVEYTIGNFLSETQMEQVNRAVQKAAQRKEKASDYNAFSEQLSRMILTSAVFSLKHLELKEAYEALT